MDVFDDDKLPDEDFQIEASDATIEKPKENDFPTEPPDSAFGKPMASASKGEEVIITDEQWQKIKDLWNSRPKNPPSIPELGELIFNESGLDGRSVKGRAIRKKLAEANLRVRFIRDSLPIELTDEQKEYILNNPKEKTLDIARTIFRNPNLSMLHGETRAVMEFRKSWNPEVKDDSDMPIEEVYSPPKTIEGVLQKINRYRQTNKIEKEKLTGKQKKDLEAVLNYLKTYRFVLMMNGYETQTDRELFESTYIRYTFDKHDLTEEDVEQYINLAMEAPLSASIRKRIEQLRKLLDESTQNSEGEDNKKISMALVEAIGKTENEYHQSMARQNTMRNNLVSKRSAKEDERKKGTASVLNLVSLWKAEKERKEMIKEGIQRQGELKDEIVRISGLDRFKGAIYGMTENEVLNG